MAIDRQVCGSRSLGCGLRPLVHSSPKGAFYHSPGQRRCEKILSCLSPQIPMSLRLVTANENARSALDCGREAAAFGSFPSAHAPKTGETKAVAAATAVQSAFGTAIFKADTLRRRKTLLCFQTSAPPRLCGEGIVSHLHSGRDAHAITTVTLLGRRGESPLRVNDNL
jgi:hypothetical protein